MRVPPARPTVLRPAGVTITLEKPVLLVDTREKVGYAFERFRRWFAAIERRPLRVGDCTIAGLEGWVAVERKSVEDLFNSCSPLGSRVDSWRETVDGGGRLADSGFCPRRAIRGAHGPLQDKSRIDILHSSDSR